MVGQMTLLLALAAFAAGVVLVVVATERLLDGLVGIAHAARVAPFVAAAILSGLEAENVAVGLAAGSRGSSAVALGTAFGGAIFLLCAALGIGAIVAPLHVRLPRGVILLLPLSAVAAGVPILFGSTPRWAGAILLLGFVAAIGSLIVASRDHEFLSPGEAVGDDGEGHSIVWYVVVTVLGIAAITVGGELVAYGAETVIRVAGVSAGLIGMVITPAAIEAEEVIRQIVPAKGGRPDVSAGNAVGTVVYFLLFNLGLIALLTPVSVPGYVRLLDWPFLLISSALAATFLWRGRVGRVEGAILVIVGTAFAVLQGIR
jgi:cation:H+ antiporter